MTRSSGVERAAPSSRAARTAAAPVPEARLGDVVAGGHGVHDLHGLVGNEAVRRLLQPGVLPGPSGGPADPAGGESLDPGTRSFMEARIGQDLSAVRVHADGPAADSARVLGALAYSVGPHVVFGAGRYDPHSPSGAGLLAHELAHVGQRRGRPPALRRKPDPARLDVAVPDPAEVMARRPFSPQVDYAWQNPLIRQSVFTTRNSALRQFLVEEKETDLRAALAGGGFTAALATDAGAEILAERERLAGDLAEHARLRKEAEVALRAAQAETRQHLAEPEVRARERTRRALAATRDGLAGRARPQRARIAQLEKLGTAIGAGQQRELDQRRGLVDEIDAELAPVAASLAEVTGELDSGLAPFTSAETALKADITEHRTQESALRPQLERVSGGVDRRTKQATREATIRWRVAQFAREIGGLEHDKLLGLVLDQFAADKDFTRFAKQERYLIVHFSGMRYATAAKTWGPPQELLATLKEQQVHELFTDADPAVVEQEAEETGAAVEAELASPDTGGGRRVELKGVQRGLGAPTAVRARLFAKKPGEQQAFEELEIQTRDRARAVALADADGVAQANQRIAQLEKQITAPELKRILAALAEADRTRLKTLRDFRVKEAKQAMSRLSDLEALSVLQDMKDAFPEWVWHEVVRRTQLRVNVSDEDWDKPLPLKTLDRKDPVTARWLAIFERWPREGTVSVDKQGEKFEIVATAVVCNQLSEQAQHTYGKTITQGIRGAVSWYREKAAKAVPGAGTGQPFFVRPTKEQDFVDGAGLFWAHFETKKKPYEGNMAHLLSGIDFLTEGKQVIRDALVENGWTYHIDPATGNITRTKGEGDAQQIQWFSWQHEATVLKRAPGRVITFETSAGARRHSWTLRSLIDPPSEPWIKNLHEDTNVFVGFAPGRDAMPQLDKALEEILPSRDAF